MNAKNIRRVLKKKIFDWLESINDEGLRKDVEKHIIVSGGCIIDMLIGEKPKDYDVYFDNKDIAKRIAKYYVDKFNERHKEKKNKFGYKNKAFVLDGEDVEAYNRNEKGLEEIAPGFSNQGGNISHMITNTSKERIKIIVRSDGVASEDERLLEEPFDDVCDVMDGADQIDAKELEKDEDRYRPVFLSTNAITLSNKIQIVIRFYGDPDEIHKNYDFVHCTNYFTTKNLKLTLRPDAMEAILARELRYVGSKYPLCSVIRTRKFIRRGWIINAGQYLKMLFQISRLDLTDIGTLEDQLVGVDSAYFMQLISALQSKKEVDKDFEINYGYIATIIDKIF
jgi:hypothetical protein